MHERRYAQKKNGSARKEWKEIRGEWKRKKKSEMVRSGDGKTLMSSFISFV